MKTPTVAEKIECAVEFLALVVFLLAILWVAVHAGAGG
jgi:hypothetical protein